ncbi:MAG: polysaccharide biosynthesis tyrosine autokinase [Bacteroidales bacterium]|nr:polysaccharide biosynthesis tyrosine autokinase [Bacteroidales bacterium]
MATERKNIPIINDKFDPYILWLVVKKSLILIGIFFLFSLIGVFLYLRYTAPIYTSTAIIQIKEEEKSKVIGDLVSQKEEVNLSQIVELLKSPEFLKRVFSKLPLFTSYYSQGTFLSYELYKTSPFIVEHIVTNNLIYNKPIYVFFEDNKIIVKYLVGSEEKEKKIIAGAWDSISGLRFKINIKNFEAIKEQNSKIKENYYFFIIRDTISVIQEYFRSLSISVINSEANTIAITFNDKNPIKAAEIPQKIAQEFILYDVEKKNESAKKILEFLEKQIAYIYNIVDSLENEIFKYKISNNIVEQKINRGTDNILVEINNQLTNIEIEEYGLKKVLDAVNKDHINLYELVVLSSWINNASLISLLTKVQQLEEQKNLLLTKFTKSSLEYSNMEKQVNEYIKAIKDLIKYSFERLQEKKDLLVKKKNQVATKDEIIKSEDLEYLRLKRLYEVNLGYYNKLLEKKSEYLITQAGNISYATILQSTNVPTEPVSPKKNQAIAIGIGMSLMLSVILIFLRYLLFSEITTISEIQDYTDAKILGIIPLYKYKLTHSQLLINVKPNSIFSESFRNCRATIEFLQKEPKNNIIAISSTVSGEGKTLISINLAGIFTYRNKKVLLVDLDLRKPRIHVGFNLENNKGVSTILTRKTSLEECIQKGPIENLFILTSGPLYPNPSELIASPDFEVFLKNISSLFDIIVIDTPPIGIVSDALTVFKLVHFPIYVIKSHFSKRSFLYNINHLIYEKNIKNLMVVLNSFDFNKAKYSNYYYNYGYGYGYAYGYSDSYKYYHDEIKKEKNIVKRLKEKFLHNG